MKSHWVYCLISKGDDIRELQVAKDGLLIRAPLEILQDLLEERPQSGEQWFFNGTMDREIAYICAGYVIANPQLVRQNGFEIVT